MVVQKSFVADPEFCGPVIRKFLNGYDIRLEERHSRSSHKNCTIERNNGVFKHIVDKLGKEGTTVSAATVAARALFLTKTFKGSGTISSFQLARGYTSSISGSRTTLVAQELIDAHVEFCAARAIQSALESKQPNSIPLDLLHKGMRI